MAYSSEKFSLDAGATETVPVIIGGYEELEDLEPIESTIEIIPNTGEKLEIVRTAQIEVGDGAMYLSILNEEFIRGGVGTVQFVLDNTGHDEIEIITAENLTQSPSTEITFYLLDADENVLYSKAFQQSLGDDIVTLSNKKSVARIQAGERFTSAPFDLHIPGNAPDDVTLRLEISNVHHHLGQDDPVTMAGLATRHQVSLRDTSYYGEVTDITPEVSTGDEDIVISGLAVDRETGELLANAQLRLVINVDGFERKVDVTTDETGSFSHTFEPIEGEAGIYTVRAVHPDLLDRPVHGEFIINR